MEGARVSKLPHQIRSCASTTIKFTGDGGYLTKDKRVKIVLFSFQVILNETTSKQTKLTPYCLFSVNDLYLGIVDENDIERLSQELEQLMQDIKTLVEDKLIFRDEELDVDVVLAADLKFLNKLCGLSTNFANCDKF